MKILLLKTAKFLLNLFLGLILAVFMLFLLNIIAYCIVPKAHAITINNCHWNGTTKVCFTTDDPGKLPEESIEYNAAPPSNSNPWKDQLNEELYGNHNNDNN